MTHLSMLARALNTGGRVAERMSSVRLDAEDVLAEARRRAGHDGDTREIEEPLRRLLESYERDAGLTFVGRIAARRDTLRLLEYGLRMAADRRRHPEIAAQEIRRPIFVTGLPRTGTTLLHGLLAQDPANRVPHTWECMFPSPRLDRWEPELNEARPGDARDTTTPAAMAALFSTLLFGDRLGPVSRERWLDWLFATRTGDARLRAGVPASWKVGDKTGTGKRGATGDVAVLWPPGRRPLVAAVFIRDSTASLERRNAAIASVGRALPRLIGVEAT